MSAICSNEILFQSDALALASRIDEGASQLLRRSVAHARQRAQGGSIVLPVDVKAADVKAAMLELLAELQLAFDAMRAGQIEEIEFSEDDFNHLAALPFRRPDVADASDDDL